MQLLRDNLTLWTSSDGNEPEAAAEASKEEAKGEAPAADTAEAPKATEEEAKPEAAA